jgi:hypothetical protein
VQKFYDMHGRFPQAWWELTRIKMLNYFPVDPTGEVYTLDPVTGSVDVSRKSTLYPLRSRAR